MTAEKSSAQVLSRIWESFAKNAERETGLPLSKSATSRNYLDGDDRLLTRWLNPGARKNWRIPLARVPDVCRELQASPEMTDRLMMAKLSEISQEDPEHPILVAASWAFGHCESQNHGLSADEQRVLAAYRSQAQRFPRGLYGARDELDTLGPVFEELLQRAQKTYEDDDAGSLDEDPSARSERKAQTDALLMKMKENEANGAEKRQKAARKAEKTAARQVREYFKKLRGRRS